MILLSQIKDKKIINSLFTLATVTNIRIRGNKPAPPPENFTTLTIAESLLKGKTLSTSSKLQKLERATLNRISCTIIVYASQLTDELTERIRNNANLAV